MTTIHLTETGLVYTENNNVLEIANLDNSFDYLKNNTYSHFFKTPFNSISYIINDKIVKTIKTHPSSFYPGSPFDVFNSVRSYLKYERLYFPRFYLYPSSFCNARCPICQFNFRRKNGDIICFESIKKMIDEITYNNPTKFLSAIISGDGEPTTHPDFDRIITYLNDKGIRIFLTSNLLLSKNREKILQIIGKKCDMLTVSIKGLDTISYAKYQGIDKDNLFKIVLENIEYLLNVISKNNRRNKILIGIASLILPENIKHYLKMIDYFISIGLDYLYLNPLEPSYSFWNIQFSDTEQKETIEVIEKIKEYQNCNTVIRYPKNPFALKNSDTVYYNAKNRKVQSICGSALWNPILIPSENGGTFLSCRSSEKFTNKDFWYTDNINKFNVLKELNQVKISNVMKTTQLCSECHLERQVKLFDEIIFTEKQYNFNGFFSLNFNIKSLTYKGGAIAFEDTF
jgi:MoaA/NifB/PqqE/SkfB family radical SAM enzyme